MSEFGEDLLRDSARRAGRLATSERRHDIALTQRESWQTSVRRVVWRDGDLAWLGWLLCLLSALVTVALLWWALG